MKTIETDLGSLNKLARGLLADSAVGFVVLAVAVTLMSVFIHCEAVPFFIRQLHASIYIAQNHGPVPSVAPRPVSQELGQRESRQSGILLASAEPIVLPSSPAAPSISIPNNNPVTTQAASAKIVRAAQEMTRSADRVVKAGHTIAESSVSAAGDNNPKYESSRKADDNHPAEKAKQVGGVKHDSSHHRH